MAYIPSRRKKHYDTHRAGNLNLTSMMDMFTIILVFLLKTYALEGQLIQPSDSLTLPKSTIKTPPESALDLVVSQNAILLNNKKVTGYNQLVTQPGFIVPSLQQALLFHALEARKMEEQFGVPFSGKVTIQGDLNIEFKELVKVMATCGASEFPNMRLVVYSIDDKVIINK